MFAIVIAVVFSGQRGYRCPSPGANCQPCGPKSLPPYMTSTVLLARHVQNSGPSNGLPMRCVGSRHSPAFGVLKSAPISTCTAGSQQLSQLLLLFGQHVPAANAQIPPNHTPCASEHPSCWLQHPLVHELRTDDDEKLYSPYGRYCGSRPINQCEACDVLFGAGSPPLPSSQEHPSVPTAFQCIDTAEFHFRIQCRISNEEKGTR